MPSETISKLRDAIKEIEEGRVVREESTTLPRYRAHADRYNSASLRTRGKNNRTSTNSIKAADASNTKESEVDLSADAAFKRIIKLVSVRDRCRSELLSRLQREDFPNHIAEEALDRAERVLIIDDIRFAEQFIRGRVSAGKGSAGIERELAQFNINVCDVPGWPYDFLSEDDEFDRALTFLNNHPPRSKSPRESAYRKLIQKGYGSDIAASASRAWWENISN